MSSVGWEMFNEASADLAEEKLKHAVTGINLGEAKELLKDCLQFLNQVPDKEYGNNYELATRVEKFLRK